MIRQHDYARYFRKETDSALVWAAAQRLGYPDAAWNEAIREAAFLVAKERGLWDQVLAEAARFRLGCGPFG